MLTEPLLYTGVDRREETVERLALALVTEILARRRNTSIDVGQPFAMSQQVMPREIFVSGALKIDPLGRTVECEGRRVEMTYMEFEVLLGLARSPGVPVPKGTIGAAIWGRATPPGSRLIDQHIHEIRRKLGDTCANPLYIRTVRKVGYVLAGRWVEEC